MFFKSILFFFIRSASDPIRTAATKCADKLQVKLDLVNKCMVSRLGNNLQHTNAVLTEKLNPSHTYVPWVTLNGIHTEDIQQKAQDDLVSLICQTYTGSNKPDACN
jgi:interferon gamma-inducible protein 30